MGGSGIKQTRHLPGQVAAHRWIEAHRKGAQRFCYPGPYSGRPGASLAENESGLWG